MVAQRTHYTLVKVWLINRSRAGMLQCCSTFFCAVRCWCTPDRRPRPDRRCPGPGRWGRTRSPAADSGTGRTPCRPSRSCPGHRRPDRSHSRGGRGAGRCSPAMPGLSLWSQPCWALKCLSETISSLQTWFVPVRNCARCCQADKGLLCGLMYQLLDWMIGAE